MEGIALTARGAGHFRADCTFPYTSALLSSTFKAQLPNQCATSGLQAGHDTDPCHPPPSIAALAIAG